MVLPNSGTVKVNLNSDGKLDLGNMTTRGGAYWTIPELLFEKKGLILAMQQLVAGIRN